MACALEKKNAKAKRLAPVVHACPNVGAAPLK